MNSHIQFKKLLCPEETGKLLKGWTPMSVKGELQQIKAWLKKQSILSKDQKRQLAQKQDNSPVEASQSSTNPKQQPEGKVKFQVVQALPSELQKSKDRKDSHGQFAQYGKNSY
ncbi:hypothetical protein O181_060931 [Austropuccinia psidii MF-1]|uniref:Uncharacterized protein n=1 Tax=Austropuccinia psidii MF-1 TaxID=1389203 RepID=A0A9Q3HX18_9BASI|nr:hypothetical protein [Austropuccinia psidii MF-1]